MSTITGEGLKRYVIDKIGTPYVYGAKIQDGVLTQEKVNTLTRLYPNMFTVKYLTKIAKKQLIGKVCVDCSGLIAGYTGKIVGSAQMHSSAIKRVPFSEWRTFPIGTVLWKSGHVGVYCGANSKGQYYCVEARGIDYGTVATLIDDKSSWKYGLQLPYIEYPEGSIFAPEPVQVVSTGAVNPYPEPKVNLKKSSTASVNGTKWLQWELIEAGYGVKFQRGSTWYGAVKIDGSFGPITDAALRNFQQSAKIECDGICGPATRAALKNNK